MIAGAPGVGKTETINQFRVEFPEAVLYTATAGEGGVRNLAPGLCKMFEMPNPNLRDPASTRVGIANAIGAEGFCRLTKGNLCQRNYRGWDNWEVWNGRGSCQGKVVLRWPFMVT